MNLVLSFCFCELYLAACLKIQRKLDGLKFIRGSQLTNLNLERHCVTVAVQIHAPENDDSILSREQLVAPPARGNFAIQNQVHPRETVQIQHVQIIQCRVLKPAIVYVVASTVN